MNRLPAALHRLVVFVIGAAAVVVGAGTLAWRLNLDPPKRWIEEIDTASAERFAHTDWWAAVLAGIIVVGVVLAGFLLVSSVRPMKAGRLILPASSDSRELSISPGLVATAAANDLSGDRRITAARGRAVDDRGRLIIRITAQAESAHSFTAIAKAYAKTQESIATAVEDGPVKVQLLVHMVRTAPVE